jgi:hypothetical protein
LFASNNDSGIVADRGTLEYSRRGSHRALAGLRSYGNADVPSRQEGGIVLACVYSIDSRFAAGKGEGEDGQGERCDASTGKNENVHILSAWKMRIKQLQVCSFG